MRIAILWRVLAVSVIAVTLLARPHADSVQSEIDRYKLLQIRKLYQAKAGHGCQTDTLFMSDSDFVLFTDSAGVPQEVEFTNPIQYVLPVDSSATKEAILNNLIELSRDYDSTSSFILKGRLHRQCNELQIYVDRVAKQFPGQFKTIPLNKLIFDNYQSTDANSEALLIDGTYAILLNDRLIDVCTWMSELVFDLTVDSTASYRRWPHAGKEETEKMAVALPRFQQLVNHFFFDCPLRMTTPGKNARKMEEYMEFFVLVHEYAHAALDHLSYASDYGDTVSAYQERELALNRWMNEVQADLFAQNILLEKLKKEFGDTPPEWLCVAGAFYLVCTDVLEKSAAVIDSRSSGADKRELQAFPVFHELLDKVKPFPLEFAAAHRYDVDSATIRLIDSLSALKGPLNHLSHPPAASRADLLLSSLEIADKSLKSSNDFAFGVSLCKAMMVVYVQSKEELCKGKM